MQHKEHPATHCPACRKEVFAADLIYSKGPLETYKCPNCSREFSGAAEPSLLEERIRLTQRCFLYIVWKDGKPSNDELLATRKMFSKLGEETLGTLKEKASAATRFFVGDYSLGEAQRLKEGAANLSLKIEIEANEKTP